MRFYLLTLIILASCKNGNDSNQKTVVESPQIVHSPDTAKVDTFKGNSETTEIICDTVYKNKGYKITLRRFNEDNQDETVPNSLFVFSKLTNGKYLPVYTDSIFNRVQDVQFADFNNDKVRDILVQNFSDVRSNWTYFLYLVDTLHNKLKKVKGFEVIKNPHYLPQYNLIDNYVMSGHIWTGFYKIQGDSVKDFEIVIYDEQKDDDSYERAYKKALKSILTARH
ncbi:hypothetical protein Niako_1716 [Niastella koreensis GR20-10]|uniref:Uncharacterized protein n=2 Tax=Niastella koreensis TaxID=354356 RepID=G8T9B1_NIAKG|nr:hypothetical protein [Niastella koreensis]AEV98079.1 hypothetical protein Niako_1716 [Niastella koreensis GR20-10]